MILAVMEWPSVLVQILFMISPGLFLSNTSTSEAMIRNYVTPNKTTPCPNGKRPCLTLKEYASESDVYFINNTIFYFHPGIHVLGESLRLKSICNFSIEGLRTGNGVVSVTFDSLASISWEKSWNIEVTSIRFTLWNNFTFIFRFELSLIVRLSNISIFGNGYSGCSSIMGQNSALDISNSMFSEIKGVFGAALMMLASNVTIRGTNRFIRNTAVSGGSIYLFDSMLTLNGSNLFQNNTSIRWYGLVTINRRVSLCNYSVNSSGHGGAIFCNTSYLGINGHSHFTGNLAKIYGGAIAIYGGAMALNDASSSINGSLSLSNNKAHLGGAISVLMGNLIMQGYTLFDGNSVKGEGGALFISYANFKFCGSIDYVNNKANNFGGALYINRANVFFDDKCSTNNSLFHNTSTVFFNNSAGGAIDYNTGEYGYYGGGAIRNSDSNITFSSTIYFRRNMARYGGGAIQSADSKVTFSGSLLFERNIAYRGGAIRSTDSKVTFSGSLLLERNIAYRGGAMLLEGSSKLIFKPILNISFILNHANDSGGALYFTDSQCSVGSTEPIECFITIDGPFASTKNISLHFENNTARITGSILYGGQFGKCRLFLKTSTEEPDQCNSDNNNYYSGNALEILKNMSTIVEHENNSLVSISSPAEKIRFCQGGDLEHYDTDLYPGQQFNISLIALDQANTSVPTTIFWEQTFGYVDIENRLSPPSQDIGSRCTNIIFQLYLVNQRTNLCFKLYPDNSCQNQAEGVLLHINVLPCPLGFEFLKKEYGCACAKTLERFTQNCYILDTDYEVVERVRNNFWIYKESNEILILHEHRCPLDYCSNNLLNVSLSDPSSQCNINRDGTLCGQCQKNFSLALGSLCCIPCDNNHTALIMFFALAGVALIVIIILLRLTVAVGTLNGLFFYANIIQANQQAFFPRATINPFTVFIAWLNLDLGIETCFYEGMDIYAYSWFQFIFPFYIWFLIGCIILACRYSQSIAKRLGQNPVAVLATLLLISYSKILQAIIVPLSWTYLTYYTASSNETRSVVWLYDGSVRFFKEPKHIALGLFAISSSVIFVVPYIFLLLFNHWLQGCSNRRVLSWLNKIKPFMDAYHAPYKKHTRYWTGLLLLSRLGLFLTFANYSDSVNIAAVSAVSIALLAIKLRVYEYLYNDILESSFLLNLGIFSLATFYLKEESEDDESQFIPSSISVGIVFVTFIGILFFHISLVLKSSNIWKLHIHPFIQKSLLLSTIFRITPFKDDTTAGDSKNTELHVLPTSTKIDVDLREPLLEITESHAATIY